MFRITFFCDDKKVTSALHALVGIAHGAPECAPVVNAVKTSNGLAAASGGSSLERLASVIAKMKGQDLKTSDAHVKDMMKSIGIKPASTGYMLRKAVEAGLLRQHGKGTGTAYKVV
jgi:predicted transcriptional regulator